MTPLSRPIHGSLRREGWRFVVSMAGAWMGLFALRVRARTRFRVYDLAHARVHMHSDACTRLHALECACAYAHWLLGGVLVGTRS